MKKSEENKLTLFDTDIKKHRYETAMDIWNNPGTVEFAAFQHSLFCQAYFPYRNPGEDVKEWEHVQGRASLIIQALKIKNPYTGELEHIGLPYGTKARLIMAYLNTQAVKNQNPLIDVEKTITSFVKELGLANKGKNITEVKNQLARIASSIITLNYITEEQRSLNVQFSLVKKYDVWFPKDEHQRVLWTSQIELTKGYFEELVERAVPLDIRALGALKNNAMAIDIYSWLAQRLHRIPHGKKQFVSWKNLKDQFGSNYKDMKKFKQVFRKTLDIVMDQYMGARLQEDKNKGYYLENSPTPIGKKSIIMISK